MRTLAIVAVVLVTAFVSVDGFPLTVLYTNDLHVRVDRLDGLAAAIEAVRATDDPVLWLDAGDGWHDYRRPLPAVWGSEVMSAWMNISGLTAMALGNHETYLGPQRLSDRLAEAAFPVLAANWRSNDPRIDVRASMALEIDDASVLVIGLITPEFLPIYAYPMMTYVDPVTAVCDELARHHDEESELVIVLAHLSIARARSLARDVPEVDLLITGHSHERTDDPIIEGKTVIVQSGAFGEALGCVRLDVADGGVTVLSNELIPIEKTPADDRAGVRRLLSVVTAILAATAVWWL